jgi:hypothetical protein
MVFVVYNQFINSGWSRIVIVFIVSTFNTMKSVELTFKRF